MFPVITVVGAGFAGVEAAWTAASRGAEVRLFEMRPMKMTPAHSSAWFAELVCSNSLKSKLPDSPAGQLKTEMHSLGSLVLDVASECEVPGGAALCVDRERFGREITNRIESHPNIEIIREEFCPSQMANAASKGSVILATGPLSSEAVAEWLAKSTGRKHLYFYDAVSPTVDASTINHKVAFAQSRYGKGEGDDYLNCPFEKESYEAFVHALVTAERVPLHSFEKGGVRTGSDDELNPEDVKYFAGCTPIEVIAEAGERSLSFGNFKPVGLTDPRTGKRPYAALQLRPENRERTLYSLVACQNRLRFGEQKRVFRMVPGLEEAEFVRYGVIHRNTFLNAPQVLTPHLELRSASGIFVSGQLTGVEGYVESAAMGIFAGLVAVAIERGGELPLPYRDSAYGSLLAHLQDDTPREFAPMNINWGLFPEVVESVRDKSARKAMKLALAQSAFKDWEEQLARIGLT